MSYSKTTWATGDTVTAAKMNKIENGIEAAECFNATYVQTEDGNGTTQTLEKTWSEISAIVQSGKIVYLVRPFDDSDEYSTYTGYSMMYLQEIYYSTENETEYGIVFSNTFATTNFTTNSSDGYPANEDYVEESPAD